MGTIMKSVAVFDRVNDAYATLQTIVITEIAAGNIAVSTPVAVCGRVALSVACAAARSYIKPRLSVFAPLEPA
jgi:hypothetical protein